MTDQHQKIKEKYGLVRGFGLLEATALNMTNMVGVGPFITIPLIIAAMGGPQCMIGWVLGALLSLCDGMVWSELGAAMPGTGGSYLFLKESFRTSRLGMILPFLFVWQFIVSGPLEVASGYIGFAQYADYFWPSWGPWENRTLTVAIGLVVLGLLYRRITAIGKLTLLLWAGMLITVGWVIAGGLIHMAHFGAKLAFDFPPDAFRFSAGFALGLGRTMLIAMFDFLGYYDICYVGGEVRNPEYVMPRAIFYSVTGVALMYSVMNFCIISVVPWREAMQSKLIVADYMSRLYGPRVAGAITILVLWTAFAACFAVLLGYSRIPYAAALDGYFFKVFARLHPKAKFPHISLLVMGGLSIVAGLLSLEWVVSALLTGRILIQFIGQIFAVHYLRKYRPDIERPFKIWLYPLPSVIAFAGWTYIFLTSGWAFILFGLVTLGAGIGAFWLWRRSAAEPVLSGAPGL
ncbi:MAG TPA: APC family permease [Bryobacterales bacterium]|jgi:APA family basic amino acid/polyamine antiporter|nr:APC family permease [Bryobacterales bacterium]